MRGSSILPALPPMSDRMQEGRPFMTRQQGIGLARLLTVALVVWLGIRILSVPQLVNHDAAVYLEAGARLLDGQRPYVDYIETNLPMIHLLSALPVWVGRSLDIAPTLPLSWLVWGCRLGRFGRVIGYCETPPIMRCASLSR
jgi:hypothetical protein